MTSFPAWLHLLSIAALAIGVASAAAGQIAIGRVVISTRERVRYQMLPGFGALGVLRRWAGMRPALTTLAQCEVIGFTRSRQSDDKRRIDYNHSARRG